MKRNNKTGYRNITVFIILFSVIIMMACQLDVPIKEMSEARLTITRAKEVKANKYASGDLKKAEELLYKSHEFATKENVKDAKKKAIESKKYGDAAITISLPLLAKDALNEAKKIYKEADLLYAEKYSKSKFNNAKKDIDEAEKLNNNNDYWNSYKKSNNALNNAIEAKNDSLARIPELNNQIEKIKNESNNLSIKRGAEFAATDIAEVNTNLTEAKKNISNKNLKEAIKNIDLAQKLLNKAKGKTIKGIAAEKITEIEKQIAEINKSEFKDIFKDDIAKASTLISNSKDLYSKKSYKESISKSDEALALLKSINISIAKKNEELKITAENKINLAESTFRKISDADKDETFKEKILKIAPVIREGRTLFDKKSYRDSIKKSDDALVMLNSIKNELDKDPTYDLRKNLQGEYVVKYRPKARDCLWRIAFIVYKDARLWPLIYMANKDKIKDPDLIFPGQKFAIPKVPKKPIKMDTGKEKDKTRDKDKKTSIKTEDEDKSE